MFVPQIEVPTVAAAVAEGVEELAGVVVVMFVVGEELGVGDARGGHGVLDVGGRGGDDGVVVAGAGEQGGAEVPGGWGNDDVRAAGA